MECPVCGSQCEHLEVEIIEYTHRAVNFDDLADYVFSTLIEKGYAVNYDDINMMLEIIDEYMIVNGEIVDDDEKSS